MKLSHVPIGNIADLLKLVEHHAKIVHGLDKICTYFSTPGMSGPMMLRIVIRLGDDFDYEFNNYGKSERWVFTFDETYSLFGDTEPEWERITDAIWTQIGSIRPRRYREMVAAARKIGREMEELSGFSTEIEALIRGELETLRERIAAKALEFDKSYLNEGRPTSKPWKGTIENWYFNEDEGKVRGFLDDRWIVTSEVLQHNSDDPDGPWIETKNSRYKLGEPWRSTLPPEPETPAPTPADDGTPS